MRRTITLATTCAAVAGTALIGAGSATAAPGSLAITADLVGVPDNIPFSCGLKVTNNGPGIARGTRIVQVVPFGIPSSFAYLGDLAPGESKTARQIDCGIYGQVSLYAVSITPDPNPGNNGAQVYPS